MRLFKFICWLRNKHQFRLPDGPDETTNIDIEHLACRTCGMDFLELIAFHEEISREAARGYFTNKFVNPAINVPAPSRPTAPVKKDQIRNSWWR